MYDYFVKNSPKNILKEHELFEDLGIWGRMSLYKEAEVVSFKKNEMVIEEGSKPHAFYIVAEGRCEATTKENDEKKRLKHYVHGDSFGEQALMLSQRNNYSVKALNDSTLVQVRRSTFTNLTEQYPGLAYDLSLKMARNVTAIQESNHLINRRQITTILPLKSGVGKTLFATNLADVVQDETDEPTALVEVGSEQEKMTGMREHDLSSVRNCDFYKTPGDEEPARLQKRISKLLKQYNHLFFLLPPEAETDFAIYLCEQSDELVALTEESEKDLYETGLFLQVINNQPSLPRPVVVLTRQNSGRFHTPSLPDNDTHSDVKTTHQLPELPQQALLDSLHHQSHALTDPDTEYGRVIRRIGRLLTGQSVGLALGGGAARGLAHIGVLEVLENEGITVDIVAGSSIGSLVGAAWARGASTEQMKEWAYDFAQNHSPWGVSNLRFPPLRGIFDTNRIERFIDGFLNDSTFSELQKPLRVVSTRLPDIKTVTFRQGSLKKAVRASISLPVIFPPVEVEDGFLVDGAVSEPVPTSTLEEAGAEYIIAVNAVPPLQVMSESPKKQHRTLRGWEWLKSCFLPTSYGNIIDIHMRSLEIMQSEQSAYSCRKADAIITPAINRHSWHEFDNPEAFIEAGRRAARAQMEEIKERLP